MDTVEIVTFALQLITVVATPFVWWVAIQEICKRQQRSLG